MNGNPADLKPSSESSGTSYPRGASPLVGRDEELRRLATWLGRAAQGHGGTIFLTGRPGIGKTRLAHEALALAKARGFTVLEGRAFPLDNRLAYAPFLDAFGPHLRSYEPAHLGVLVDGLPDLGRLFGDLQLPPLERLGDPALEKTRLFEAVARLLERLTREAPVVLFIDDAHWADPATVELLHYLARGLGKQRALLLATHRADDLGAADDWQEAVESLQRAGLAEEVVIPELGPDMVEKLVRSILGGEAPGELLPLIKSRAAGIPLFVEALIEALVDTGTLSRNPSQKGGWTLNAEGATALPPTIHRLIQRRLARLAPADRRVIDLIAVLGNGTAHVVLRTVSGMEEETLLETLRRLSGAGLVAEAMEGSDVVYRITHPLIQEVAYAELPQMLRRRVHVAAIDALESPSEGQPADISRLAYHYRGAGPGAKSDRVLAVLAAAGERALALYANEEAARHFDAAVAMAREGGGWRVEGGEAHSTLNPQPFTLAQLLERLGEAWERIGKRGAAVKAWNEALAERERAGDAVAASHLRCHLALAEWDHGHFDIAHAHLSAGLAALAGREPCQELADLHFARFLILSRLGDVAGVEQTVLELVSLAERLASPRAEGEANLAACSFLLWQKDIPNAEKHAQHALTVGERAQDLVVCCRAQNALAGIGMRLGDHHLVRSHAERGLAGAQRLGAPDLEVVLRLRLAHADYMRGDWDQSLRSITETISLARRVGRPRDIAYSLANQGMILALRGDLSEAEACVSEAKMAFNGPCWRRPVDRVVFSFIDIAEAALALERMHVERALAIAETFTRLPPPSMAAPSGFMLASISISLMLLAEAQVAAGKPESALETARELIGLGPSGTPYLAALAARAEGLARQALGQPQEAMDCLAQAHDKFTALDIPFEAARSLLERAAAAVATQPRVAAAAAQQTLVMFESLGANRYADRARALLRGLGVRPIGPHRARPNGGPLLSAREFEIARLVAEGLTTPEIAKRLFLSPLTVSNHLHHIYTRLGIASRAALARYMTEAGLA